MGRLIGLFIWLKQRLSEPSTMASIASIAALAGIKVEPGLVQDALNVGTLVFGTAGFFVAEQKPKTEVK